jgi:transcriptional regulator with XRE-family HTH domain
MSRLKEWRKGKGLSLAEVAALTGRSVAGVSRIERGERGLRPLQRVAFARALGVSIEEIFEREPPG